MATFTELTNELLGHVPNLSIFLAESFTLRAWRQICDSYRWSFKRVDGAINCPAQITAGHVALTQFQITVTADATASAALLAAPATPGLSAMQIRFTGTGTTYGIYNITGVDDSTPTAIILTLDRIVMEPTAVSAAYQCYRCYVTAPYSDTKRILSIVDMANAQPLGKDYTSETFDRYDPQRQSQGRAYRIGAYQPQADGTLRFELWPHPTTGQVFYTRMERSGADLFASGSDELPPAIPDDLVVKRAIGWHVYPWAALNPTALKGQKSPNWLGLMAAERAEYRTLWLTAKRDDDNLALTSVWDRGHGLRPMFGRGLPIVIDANWFQTHAGW